MRTKAQSIISPLTKAAQFALAANHSSTLSVMTTHNIGKLAVVGKGNMLGDFLKNVAKPVDVISTSYPEFPIEGVNYHKSPDEVQSRVNVLVLGFKPKHFTPEIMDSYKDMLHPENRLVISIAAGVTTETISDLLQINPYDQIPVIRIMPQLTKQVFGLYANEHVSDRQKIMAIELMSSLGKAIEVGEQDGINKVTAAAGSGPGYIFELMRIYSLAIKDELGFNEKEAELITFSTFYGCAKMAMESGKSLAELRDMVATKGGTTEAGLRKLLRNVNRNVNEGKGPDETLALLKINCDSSILYTLLRDTVEAAYKRAGELGEKKTPDAPSRFNIERDLENDESRIEKPSSYLSGKTSTQTFPHYHIK